MFLKAGALSLLLLLASRLLGLLRETFLASALGASESADLAIVMLTIPDWLTGLLLSGALSYVLLPFWATQSPAQVARGQVRLNLIFLVLGCVLALALVWFREPFMSWLVHSLPKQRLGAASQVLLWSALALPAAFGAAVWTARLQHESDFVGMYGANLVVNGVLIVALWLLLARALGSDAGPGGADLVALGVGLVAAMLLRLVWLHWRVRRVAAPSGHLGHALPLVFPGASVWVWAGLSAGLPLLIPFLARSIASAAGVGELATFNYAWKLVELPMALAVQLVASLAFPAISRALAGPASLQSGGENSAVRSAFALAWTLACMAVAGVHWGASGVADLLFGWGRMGAGSLDQVAAWGRIGVWSLLPQALAAVALVVLASLGRMRWAVLGYVVALGALALQAAWVRGSGAQMMWALDLDFALMAFVVLWALRSRLRAWLPGRCMLAGAAALAVPALLSAWVPTGWASASGPLLSLALGAVTAVLVGTAAWYSGPDLKAALRR